MSLDSAPGVATVHKVGITVTTDSDDALDALIDFFIKFAEGDLRDLLSVHDPVALTVVDASDGFTHECD